MPDFAEVVLKIGYDYGAVGGLSYSNTIIQTASGWTQVNSNWGSPLGRWQLGDRRLRKQEWTYLRHFFNARRGSAQPFRYLDWSDYEFDDELVAIADGVKSQFEVYRNYGDAYGQTQRRIYKLDPQIRINPRPLSIDYNNGTIKYNTPPANGTEIRATGIFYTPVRFEQDNLELRFIAMDPESGEQFFDLGQLSVVEVRI